MCLCCTGGMLRCNVCKIHVFGPLGCEKDKKAMPIKLFFFFKLHLHSYINVFN